MAIADLSFFTYILPILVFLVVFMISFAMIKKLGFFDKPFWSLFLSFLISTIFIVAIQPREYVQTVIPWFAILLVSFFLILVMFGLAKFKEWDSTLGKAFGIILLVLFVISGIFVFSSYFSPYLPWNSGIGANPDVKFASDWVFSPRVFGAILLVAVSALVSYFLVKE